MFDEDSPSLPTVVQKEEGIRDRAFTRYSTTADIVYALVNNQPLSLVVLGSDKVWRTGVVICYAKAWHFREIIFDDRAPRVDRHGFTFHHVQLSDEETTIKPAEQKIPTFDLWDYAVLLPDLTSTGRHQRYAAITRKDWLSLNKDRVWDTLH